MVRRVLWWLLLAAAAWLVIAKAAELRTLAVTLVTGAWQWLLVGVAMQVAYYALYTLSYREAFRTVGIERRLRELVPAVLGALFVNVVTPTAGAGGPALIIDDAKRHGHSASAATSAVLLAQIADFASFGVVMACGLAYLAATGRLAVIEVLAALALIALIVAFVLVFVSAFVRPAWLTSMLRLAQRAIAATWRLFRRPTPLPEDWAQRASDEFVAAAHMLRSKAAGIVRTGSAALLGYGCDLIGLWAIAVAFGFPRFGPALAAYAVGVLFWIVSPIPQGVGIVEGAIALVLTSFGAPVATAAAISLVFRGLSFWLPFAIGGAVVRRSATFADHSHPHSDVAAVRIAAALVAVAGMVNVLSAVTPSLRYRLEIVERLVPLQVRYGSRLTAALAGVALLLLASGLWRRKRVAWLLSLGVLAVSAVVHLLKGLDYEEATVAAVAIAWLASHRASFQARSDPPSVRQGLRVLAAAAAITLAYGTAGFFLLDRQFKVNFGLWAAIRQTWDMFTQFYDPQLQPIPVTRLGRYFAGSIYVVGATVFAYALIMLLRPAIARRPSTRAGVVRASRVVRSYGRSSLARIVLLPDKLYWFDLGGSVVGYGLSTGVAVSLGDPIGPADDAEEAVRGFLRMCSLNGWVPSFYQTLPDLLPVYRGVGLQSLRIGQEAVVRLDTFTLEGSEKKSLRSRVRKLTKDGYEVRRHDPPHDSRFMGQLRKISDEWLTKVNGQEMRFSLGWFDPSYLQDCAVLALHAPQGDPVAFMNLIPEYQKAEATLDLMRSSSGAPSGAMDLLFVKAFEDARSRGAQTFNLGLSPLSGLGDHQSDPALEHALRLVYEHLGSIYGFEGLHDFKQKFDPEWQDRYLIHPGVASLPRITLALARLDAGEGAILGYARSAAVRLLGRAGGEPGGGDDRSGAGGVQRT